MNRAQIEALITKLEAATEGSRALSDEVLLTCGWQRSNHQDRRSCYWTSPDGRTHSRRPDPTRSLDDAVTLVPEGWLWSVGVQNTHKRTGPSAFIWKPDVKAQFIEAATPALALCIAALKARLVQAEAG